jgi:F-type H+-transporting ATPase subunit epsilon
MKMLHLELVTPSARVYRGDVRSVAVPAWKGDMGVLPGHAPFLGILTEGHVSIRTSARHADQGARRLSFHISGGCVEILPDSVTIMADSAAPSDGAAEADLHPDA